MASLHYKSFHALFGMLAFVLVCQCHVMGQQDSSSETLDSQSQIAQPESFVAAIPAATPKEQKVKAAYLYNFCRYFDWPAQTFNDDSSPFVIGVLGPDPLGNQLDVLAKKKTVRNRKINVHRFNSIEQHKPCQMLFVTRSVTEEEFQRAIKLAEENHILIVSEKPPATRQGSSVQIYIDPTGRVGFEIDVGVVNARQLQVNAKLLKLARVSNSIPN